MGVRTVGRSVVGDGRAVSGSPAAVGRSNGQAVGRAVGGDGSQPFVERRDNVGISRARFRVGKTGHC